MLRSSSLFRAREQVSLGMSRIVSEDVNTIYVCFAVMTSYFHIHQYNTKRIIHTIRNDWTLYVATRIISLYHYTWSMHVIKEFTSFSTLPNTDVHASYTCCHMDVYYFMIVFHHNIALHALKSHAQRHYVLIHQGSAKAWAVYHTLPPP